jgi:hypothetical protein
MSWSWIAVHAKELPSLPHHCQCLHTCSLHDKSNRLVYRFVVVRPSTMQVVLSSRFSSQGASNDGSNRRDRISHIRTVFKVSEKDASDSL